MMASARSSLGLVGITAGLLVAPALFASCGGGQGGSGGSSASGTAGYGGQGGDDLTIAAGGGTAGSGGAPVCSDAMAPPSEGGDPGCASAQPGLTYANDVQPVLVQNCTGELCHLVPSYAFLVDQKATQCCDGRLRVAPGDAAHSYLMNTLTGHDLCGGAPMPFGKPMLPEAQIQRIHDWICDGAPQQ
jgi:hypothetical protein